jgi:EmrB/QacA subfamily drug resistance transporter
MAVTESTFTVRRNDGEIGEADPRRWKALAVLALVQFMIVIDITVVNVALPSIQRALHFSAGTLSWVVDGYALTAGGLLLLGGRAGDLLGRRRLFLLGTGLFAVASLISGAAQNQAMLIVGRFAQGAGEALASPAALALVVLLFTDAKERTRALGIWGGLAGLGATIGVVLSGIVVSYLDWRWIFFINIPIAAVALVLLPGLVSESKAEGASRRFDVPGAILVTGGVLALVEGFIAASRHPWGSGDVVLPLIGGIAALLALVVVESRSADPLIPLKFFENRTRVSANIATAVMASGMFGMFFLLTLYLQQVLAYSPMKAGLAYVPFGIGLITGIGVSTAVLERIGPRALIAVAYAIVGVGLLLLTGIGVHSSYVTTLLPSIIMISFGMGAAFPAIQIAALHQVSEQDAGLGSGVQNTVMQVGGSLGLAVLVTVALRHAASGVAAGESQILAATHGYALAFRVAAGALFAAGLIALALFPKRSAQTDADDEVIDIPELELDAVEEPV